MMIVACTSLIIEALVLRMYNLGNTRDIPKWMQRLFIRKTQAVSPCRRKEPGLHAPLQKGAIIIHHDNNDAPEENVREDDWKLQCSDSPDRLDNAELWKMVALSFEEKTAFLMLCAIAGNIVSTSLYIAILSNIYSTA